MLLAAALVLCTGRGEAITDARFEFSQVHMGMPVRLVLYARDAPTAHRAAESAFGRIAELDQILSDYRPDSEVNRLVARGGEWVAATPDLFAVLERSLAIARLSDGAFDPTIGPLVALWREARRTSQLPTDAAVAAARARVGWQRVELDRGRTAVRLHGTGMRLDFGGIAKGYIIQQSVRVLAARGLTRVLVEAGGDIIVGDPPPGRSGWSVELPDDDQIDSKFAARAANLSNAALATSGPGAQYVDIDGVRYSHVIDPKRGIGLTHRLTARVIDSDGATADALATALTVAGREAAARILTRFPTAIVSISTR